MNLADPVAAKGQGIVGATDEELLAATDPSAAGSLGHDVVFDPGRLPFDPGSDRKVTGAKIESARIGHRDVVVDAVEGKTVAILARRPRRTVDQGSVMA